MRVDQYLWRLRYFKSRSKASEACKKGHVRIEDIIVKPSRDIFIGDKIMVRKNQIWYELAVLDTPKSRVGAKILNLYREDRTQKDAFKNAEIQANSKVLERDKGTGRPTKKDRREIEKYREEET
jgi:ribosome-associated heat shock protein Hsp15